MEQGHPNWVAERVKCDMQRLFTELHELIKEDVRRRMQVVKERREDRNYHATGDGKTQSIVNRTGLQGEGKCEFTLAGNTVHVHAEKPEGNYTITTRWDAEAVQCKVVLAGATPEPVERPHDQLWKIVQTILEPFFLLTT